MGKSKVEKRINLWKRLILRVVWGGWHVKDQKKWSSKSCFPLGESHFKCKAQRLEQPNVFVEQEGLHGWKGRVAGGVVKDVSLRLFLVELGQCVTPGTGVFAWDSLEWVSGFVFNNSVSMSASFVPPSHFGQWFIATGGALGRMLSVLLTHSGRAETEFVWLWRNKQKSSRAYHSSAKDVWKKRIVEAQTGVWEQ